MPRLLEPGHEIVSGSIGMGKSHWVLYLIVKSLMHGRPCCYLDPKGDTYRNPMAFFATTDQGRYLWDALQDYILLLNPVSPCDHIVGFNAIAPLGSFANASPDPIALLANSLVSHIRRQAGFEMAEANRLQNVMSAALGLLLEGGQGKYTLAELPLLFRPPERPQDKRAAPEPHNPFVRSLLSRVSHPGTLSFWRDQWPTWTPQARREWVQSTEGRIYQYLFDERLLWTVCTTRHATLDLQRVVDKGYWLFVNLPYGLLSDTITSVLGNLLITRILYACMQRSPGARPYRLILDEARFFSSGPLDIILETSRAYGLWLTLVVQSIDQLCRAREGRIDERLKELVLNLCRYFTIFHNAQDADVLAQLMFPLTGRVPVGIRTSGDLDYLPVQAELDEHRRRFMHLRQREMVFYDRLGEDPPQVWRTPEVLMDPPDDRTVQAFESAHLGRIGRPAVDIRAEISHRREQVLSSFFEGSSSKPKGQAHSKPSFGEPLT